jgi:hypothetical protein
MTDFSAPDRLLLGTVGWQRADWLAGYYPADLPPDWRLAYYANDCGCVMLPTAGWCAVAAAGLRQALDEAPDHLLLFVEAPRAGRLYDCPNLDLFAARNAVLLVDRPDPGYRLHPQWVAQGPDLWVDSDSGARLVRWTSGLSDLRALRARAAGMSGRTRALVLDGAAASPGAVAELRTLLELMGKA